MSDPLPTKVDVIRFMTQKKRGGAGVIGVHERNGTFYFVCLCEGDRLLCVDYPFLATNDIAFGVFCDVVKCMCVAAESFIFTTTKTMQNFLRYSDQQVAFTVIGKRPLSTESGIAYTKSVLELFSNIL